MSSFYKPEAKCHGRSFEDAKKCTRKVLQISCCSCPVKDCLPSQLVIDMMTTFHPKDGKCHSPLSIKPPDSGIRGGGNES